MKKLNVPFLPQISRHDSPIKIASELDKLVPHHIDTVPWKDYSYKPNVEFQLAHIKDALCIKYSVTEKNTKAVHWQHNGPMYKDSCVELFISLDGLKNYYNFEFNCAGFCLAEYGQDKPSRSILPIASIQEIRTLSCIQPNLYDDADTIHWELTAVIPFSVFLFDKIESLAGVKALGNFYKCGDELVTPHFVCWNNIDSPAPNFHLPQYFGEIYFEK